MALCELITSLIAVAAGCLGLDSCQYSRPESDICSISPLSSRSLIRSFKLGADASVAAGPVGVGTGATVTADMISFARSKGIYAGLTFDGAVLAPDTGANNAFYGKPASPVDILVRADVHNPAAVPLQQSLGQMTR